MTLEAFTRPMKSHGTFLLPHFDPEVPSHIGSQNHILQALAKFSLEAAQVGFKFPDCELDPDNLVGFVQKQLQAWIDDAIGSNARSCLRGFPHWQVSDSKITFLMNADASLQVHRLKPVIESLENIEPGLGWYVVGVLERSEGQGIPLYSPRKMGELAEHMFHCALTDEEFALEILAQNGEEPSTPDELEETVAELAKDQNVMPSEVLDSVGGHAHLLGWVSRKREAFPKYLRNKQAENISKVLQAAGAVAAVVLQDAIALHRLFAKKKGGFQWKQLDDEEQMGAACFLVWDEFDCPGKVVEMHEQYLYESGYGVECLCRISVPLDASSREIKQFVKQIRHYLVQWNALGNLLAHFREGEDS
ncbi:MAG: PRTRC system protein F [Rhodoferax sp.]|nr:PRTRC system protein F [Rhodoferax sp.]